MNKMVLTCAMALATLGTLDAHAQAYGELGYTSATIKNGGLFSSDSSRFDQDALRAVLGYELTPNVAVEGMATFGIGTNSLTENGSTVAGVRVKLDNVIGAYIKPKMRLGEKVEVFGRIGIARTQLTQPKYGRGSVSRAENVLALGAGLSYFLTPAISLNVDYMDYSELFGKETSSVTVGVGYKF